MKLVVTHGYAIRTKELLKEVHCVLFVIDPTYSFARYQARCFKYHISVDRSLDVALLEDQAVETAVNDAIRMITNRPTDNDTSSYLTYFNDV